MKRLPDRLEEQGITELCITISTDEMRLWGRSGLWGPKVVEIMYEEGRDAIALRKDLKHTFLMNRKANDES